MAKFVGIRVANAKENVVAHLLRVSGDPNFSSSLNGRPSNRAFIGGEWVDITKDNVATLRAPFHKARQKAIREIKKSWDRHGNGHRHTTGFFDGVIYFSADQLEAVRQKKGADFAGHLEALAKESVERILDTMGVSKNEYILAIHFDEETPHIHFAAKNLNLDGKSALWHYKQQKGNLSRLQDEIYAAFKGDGFIRGLPRTETKKRHVDTYAYKRRLALDMDQELAAKKLDIEALDGVAEAPDLEAAYQFMTQFKLKNKDLAEALRGAGANTAFNKIQRTLGELVSGKKQLEEALAGFEGKHKNAIQILDKHISEVWGRHESFMGHLTKAGVNELRDVLVWFARGVAEKASQAEAVEKKERELEERENRLKTAEHKLGAIQYQTNQLKADFDTLQAQIEVKRRELSNIDQQVKQKREAKEQKKSFEVSR